MHEESWRKQAGRDDKYLVLGVPWWSTRELKKETIANNYRVVGYQDREEKKAWEGLMAL